MAARAALALGVGLLLAAFAAEAVPAPSTPKKEVVPASFVPLNATVFRMRTPSGKTLVFQRDAEEPNLLHGAAPWQAELDGRRALLMTEPGAKGGQLGYMFYDGYLRQTLINGKENRLPAPEPGSDAKALAALWPAPDARMVAGEAPDIWKKGRRLRLWFDNPNKAGLLFAEIALAALALVLMRPWWARILGGLLALGAFGCMLASSSRGAFLAFLCGLGLMALTRLRTLFNWRRLALLAAAVVVAAGCLFASGQGERLVKNLFNEGQTEQSRLTVWKQVPSMIVDAPGGWGWGQSARSYIDWYQEKNNCLLKDMISGHLTFLVETGWVARFGYLLVWGLFLLAALRMAHRGRSPIPLGIAGAFAVAACFNPVISVWELWLIPVAAMVAVGADFRRWSWKSNVWTAGFAAFCALLVLGGVVAYRAWDKPAMVVHKTSTGTVLNGKSAAVYLAEDDYVLHGGYWWLFGNELRGYFREHADARAVAHVRRVADLPDAMEKLVLVGETGRDFLQMAKRPSAKEIVFVSPPFTWREVPLDLFKAAKVSLVAGELAMRKCGALAEAPEWVKSVRGAELYIPGWTELLK